jgi:hypothetical protein
VPFIVKKQYLPRLELNFEEFQGKDTDHPKSKQPTEAANKPRSDEIIMSLEPGGYEIILVLDTCETSHASVD